MTIDNKPKLSDAEWSELYSQAKKRKKDEQDGRFKIKTSLMQTMFYLGEDAAIAQARAAINVPEVVNKAGQFVPDAVRIKNEADKAIEEAQATFREIRGSKTFRSGEWVQLQITPELHAQLWTYEEAIRRLAVDKEAAMNFAKTALATPKNHFREKEYRIKLMRLFVNQEDVVTNKITEATPLPDNPFGEF